MLVKTISAPSVSTAPTSGGTLPPAVALLSYYELQVALNASDMPTNARRDTTVEQIAEWAAQGIARLGTVDRVVELDGEAREIDRRRGEAWECLEIAERCPALAVEALCDLLDADHAYKRFWGSEARGQRCVDMAFTLAPPAWARRIGR